jgi:predicted component of type VI protein secretion system
MHQTIHNILTQSSDTYTIYLLNHPTHTQYTYSIIRHMHNILNHASDNTQYTYSVIRHIHNILNQSSDTYTIYLLSHLTHTQYT